jgi:hypothetical protein
MESDIRGKVPSGDQFDRFLIVKSCSVRLPNGVASGVLSRGTRLKEGAEHTQAG